MRVTNYVTVFTFKIGKNISGNVTFNETFGVYARTGYFCHRENFTVTHDLEGTQRCNTCR